MQKSKNMEQVLALHLEDFMQKQGAFKIFSNKIVILQANEGLIIATCIHLN